MSPFKSIRAACFGLFVTASGVMAQGAMGTGEKAGTPSAGEMLGEVATWIGAHPGISIAVTACVVSVVGSIIYNRRWPQD